MLPRMFVELNTGLYLVTANPSRVPEFIPVFSGEVRVAHRFSFFVLSCYVSLRSDFRVVPP
jgi:hypothetical protein